MPTVVLGRALFIAAFPLFARVSAAQTNDRLLRPFAAGDQLSEYLKVVLVKKTPPPRPEAQCTVTPAISVDSAMRGSGPATVTGTVNGPTEPLSDASVGIRGINLRTISLADGSFTFVVPAESLTTPRTLAIEARRIGYRGNSFDVVAHQGDRIVMRLPICQAALQLESVTLSAAVAVSQESITNNQHDGVDEGDIVKRHGDHLIILRRGRLFSVDVGRGRLQPVSSRNAYGPGIDPSATWYDEMLVSGDRIVVIGYSYRRHGTELGIFRIDRDGQISYEATYNLRSGDYYSARNYASRLVGTRLVMYSPLGISGDSARPLDALPSLRRWRSESDTGAFRPIASAQHVYRFADADSADRNDAMHSVTTCDLAAAELACESTIVIGPWSRSFYVSPSAVYLALSRPPVCRPRCRADDGDASTLVRMPLHGGRPSAIGIRGSPIDQFSFLERDGALHLLLEAQGWGDWMWAPEFGSGRLALLRLPLTRFDDGSREALPSAYRVLPPLSRNVSLQNRFVGEHLLYGTGNSWGDPKAPPTSLVVVPLDGTGLTNIRLASAVDRIEVMGRRAVVVGADTNDVRFTAIHLGRRPFREDEYIVAGVSQGELRSHGFFYKADGRDEDRGTLGLPVRGRGEAGWKHLVDESAGIVFLRNDDGDFRSLGRLNSSSLRQAGLDACAASCTDWYGNSRPLFFDGRAFALLGYEIVEGRLESGRIREVRRASMLK